MPSHVRLKRPFSDYARNGGFVPKQVIALQPVENERAVAPMKRLIARECAQSGRKQPRGSTSLNPNVQTGLAPAQ
jgi:hypothetical protein